MHVHIRDRECVVGHRVARIFDPHLGAAVEQHADGDVDRRLRPARDDDLVGITAHGAGHAQVVAERLAQLRQPARIGVSEVHRVQRANRAMRDAAPRRHRARIDARAPHVERCRVGFGDECPQACEGLRAHRHARRLAARARYAVERATLGRHRKIGGDERARARLPRDVPLGEQLLVGRNHGRACHTQARGELTRGGQACARRQRPGHDRRAKLQVHLPEQRRAGRPVDLPRVEIRPPCGSHARSRNWYV